MKAGKAEGISIENPEAPPSSTLIYPGVSLKIINRKVGISVVKISRGNIQERRHAAGSFNKA